MRFPLLLRPSGLAASSVGSLLAAGTLIATVLGAPLAAQTDILGADGTVYRAIIGTEDELFQVGTGLGERRILVLDAYRDGSTTRMPVPASLDALEAHLPELAYLSATDSLFIFWESQVTSVHSRLNAVQYSPEAGFSEVAEISGKPFARRIETTALPVFDEAQPLDSEEDVTPRSFLHVAWTDDFGDLWYAPTASAMDAVETGLAISLSEEHDLARGGEENRFVLSTRPGAQHGSLVLARLDRLTGQVDRFEFYLIPAQLSELARRAEEEIANGDPTGTLIDHSDSARATIVNIGRSLEPALTGALGADIADRALAWAGDPSDLDSLASALREDVLLSAARLDRYGFTPPAGQASVLSLDAISSSYDVLVTRFESGSAAGDLEILPTPASEIRVSSDGQRLALYTVEETGISYRVWSAATGWSSSVTFAALHEELSRERVIRLLDGLLES